MPFLQRLKQLARIKDRTKEQKDVLVLVMKKPLPS